MSSWVVRLLVTLGVMLVAGTMASSRPAAGSAACSLQSKTKIPVPRDCTIRGTVSGNITDSSGTTKWGGNLVLRQQFAEGKVAVDCCRFVVSAGTSIAWEHKSSSGGCTVEGAGALTAKQLQGALTVGELIKPGQWTYDLYVGLAPAGSQMAMPATESCPSGVSKTDLAVPLGSMLGFASNHDEPQPKSNVTVASPKDLRKGTSFSGASSTPPGSATEVKRQWNLTGRVFADEISQHGLDYIKKAERLWQPCTASGARWESFKKAAPAGYTRICAYEDVLGFCTIGYGHLIHGKTSCTADDEKLRWTKEQAEQVFLDDVKQKYEPSVRVFSGKYSLNQCQFDALMSFTFNVGTKAFGSLTRKLPKQGWEAKLLERLIKHVYGDNPEYGKEDPRTGQPINPLAPKKIPLPALIKRRTTELKWFGTFPCPCEGTAAP